MTLGLTPPQLRMAFGGARMLVGTGAWFAPATSAAAFNLGAAGEDPHTALVIRLFGVRDLMLGATLLPTSPLPHQVALQAGIVADAADMAAAILHLARTRRRARGWGVLLGAAAFASAGILLLTAGDG